MGALSTMLRDVARRLEWQASHTLPEAWARAREILGRRVCITAEERGTAVSVMEAAASEIDRLEAALAEARAKLRELEGEVSYIVNESDGVCGWHHNGEVAKWSEFGGMIAALAAAAPDGGEAP